MTLTEAKEILRNYNLWRRGADIPQPCHTKIGIALDIVLDKLDKIVVEL